MGLWRDGRPWRAPPVPPLSPDGSSQPWPTTVYGRYHYLRNVDGQPVKAHRTSYSCIVTVGATKRTSRESSVLWEPRGWPLILFHSIINRFHPPRAWGRPDVAHVYQSLHRFERHRPNCWVWKGRWCWAPRWWRYSFNGAIAFQRWKVVCPRDFEAGAGASMGPSPFSDGRCRVWISLKTVEVGFNGAIAFQRWKGSAEDVGEGRDAASMGPSPFSDGRSIAIVSQRSLLRLQWGHRLSAMEGRRRRAGTPEPFRRFNGAIAFQRWKVVGAMASPTTMKMLQWGHRLSAMEGGSSWLLVLPAPGFNGAIAFQRWKGGRGTGRCRS